MPYTNDPEDIADRVAKIIKVRAGADLSEDVLSALMLIEGLAVPAGYTQSEMETLHVWLTAHLYEVNVQRKFEQRIGKTMEKPETKVDLGLNLTRPGQQVLMLDYKKAFAQTVTPIDQIPLRRVRVVWAGTPREAF